MMLISCEKWNKQISKMTLSGVWTGEHLQGLTLACSGRQGNFPGKSISIHTGHSKIEAPFQFYDTFEVESVSSPEHPTSRIKFDLLLSHGPILVLIRTCYAKSVQVITTHHSLSFSYLWYNSEYNCRSSYSALISVRKAMSPDIRLELLTFAASNSLWSQSHRILFASLSTHLHFRQGCRSPFISFFGAHQLYKMSEMGIGRDCKSLLSYLVYSNLMPTLPKTRDARF